MLRIRKKEDGQYYFTFCTANGQPMIESLSYTRRSTARRACERFKDAVLEGIEKGTFGEIVDTADEVSVVQRSSLPRPKPKQKKINQARKQSGHKELPPAVEKSRKKNAAPEKKEPVVAPKRRGRPTGWRKYPDGKPEGVQKLLAPARKRHDFIEEAEIIEN